MYPCFIETEPHDRSDNQIRNWRLVVGSLKQEGDDHAAGGKQQPPQFHAFRVDDRDDYDGTDVVDNCEAKQENSYRSGYSIPNYGQDPDRESNVSCYWNGPTARIRRTGDSEVDDRRDQHPADCGYARQHCCPQRSEVPAGQLTLDLQTDHKKKHRHDAVVDPMA